MDTPETTLVLFYLFNILRPGLYVPQIASLAREGGGAETVPCKNLLVWIGAYASAAACAVINITNWVLFGTGLINVAGRLSILPITLRKRRHAAASVAL